MGVPLADIEGVTIRCRAGDAPDPDTPAGAADIFDHDGLSERNAHPLGHDPGSGIGRTARREWHHQRNGARGIALRMRICDACEDEHRKGRPKSSHAASLGLKPNRLVKRFSACCGISSTEVGAAREPGVVGVQPRPQDAAEAKARSLP